MRLRRSTRWHAERGIPIGRKVAWKVLGFESPGSYRLWRDERIRHEVAAGRQSPTSAAWLAVQPRAYRVDALGPAAWDAS